MATNHISDSEMIPHVRPMQIIVGSQVFGPLVFLVIAVVMRAMGDAQAPDDDLLVLRLFAFIMAAICVVLHFVVPNIVATNVLKQSEPSVAPPDSELQSKSDDKINVERFSQAYKTKTIIEVALLEAPAFFAIIVYLIEGDLLCILLAVLLVMGIAVRFPTTSKVAAWIEAKHRQLEEERHLSN